MKERGEHSIENVNRNLDERSFVQRYKGLILVVFAIDLGNIYFCRYFVNQLDTHRCMKGAERKIHDDRWLWREGKAIRVVSKAIEVCEKKTSIDSSDVSMTIRPKNTNIDSAGVSMTVMPKYMLLFAAVVTTLLLI